MGRKYFLPSYKTSFQKMLFCAFILLICANMFGCKRHEGSFQGYVEGKYAYLASAVAGNLIKLNVARGDHIIASQELFLLDPSPEAEKLEQAKQQYNQAQQTLLNLQQGQRDTVVTAMRAKVAQATASLEYQAKMLGRYQTLLKTKTIGKATVDSALAAYQQSYQKVREAKADLLEAEKGAREHLIVAQEAVVAAAEAQVKQAEWALKQKTFVAPQTAEVFDTFYEVGEFVPAGQPVVATLLLEKMKAVFFVPEKTLSHIKIGDDVTIKCDNCEQVYHAKISYISPNAEYTPPVIFSSESKGKLVFHVEAILSLQDARLFHPGQPVTVDF